MLQNDIYIVDYKTNIWFDLSLPLPYLVHGHALLSLNDEIYVLGGRGDHSTFYKDVYRLNSSMRWERLTDMTVGRYGITNSSVALDGYIWTCGGHSGFDYLKSVEKYDPVKDKWTKIS